MSRVILPVPTSPMLFRACVRLFSPFNVAPHLLRDLACRSKRLHEHGFVVGNRRWHRVDVDDGHYRVLSECPVGS